MRVLYYSPEYYCNHGGRTHAREFFAAVTRLSEVEEAWVFPSEDQEGGQNLGGHSREGAKYYLKTLLRNLFPSSFISLARILFPSKTRYQKLKSTIAEKRIDCAVMRIGGAFMYLPRLRRDFPNLKIVVEMNATIFAESHKNLPFIELWRKLEIFCMKKANAITTVSSYWRDYLISYGVDREAILVNPNGVNPDHFHHREKNCLKALKEQYGIPEESFVLGYVGGMETFRRLPEVVDGFAELRQSGKGDLFLLIIGDGVDMPIVQQRIRKNHDILDGWISCPGGWVPYEKIPQIMSLFDVAIFPYSNPYGSPQKLFEYLAMGIPTIGPDVPAVSEIFKDKVHLITVKQDGSNLEEVINAFINDPDTRKKIAKEGHDYILSNYTWENNAKRVVSLTHSEI
jgi:glycosyltransferase involved in cell wall biosynthesis